MRPTPARRTGGRSARSAVLLAAAAIAASAARGDCSTALLGCRDIQDGTARLACFDRESACLVTAVNPAPRSAPPGPFGSPAAPTPRTEETQQVATLHALLQSVAVRADGRSVFTLDNGQVWRTLEPGSDLLGRAGEAVELSRNRLGSYWLRLASGRGCKVTRER
jgi:hypothetical protein